MAFQYEISLTTVTNKYQSLDYTARFSIRLLLVIINVFCLFTMYFVFFLFLSLSFSFC